MKEQEHNFRVKKRACFITVQSFVGVLSICYCTNQCTKWEHKVKGVYINCTGSLFVVRHVLLHNAVKDRTNKNKPLPTHILAHILIYIDWPFQQRQGAVNSFLNSQWQLTKECLRLILPKSWIVHYVNVNSWLLYEDIMAYFFKGTTSLQIGDISYSHWCRVVSNIYSPKRILGYARAG